MNLTYAGHSCFLIEHDGHRIIIDPFLTYNPQAAFKAEEIQVEAVLVTHGHGDHVGDAVAIAQRCGCPIIANYEICMTLAKKGVQVEPMHIGGTIRLSWGWVKMTQALHGSEIEGLAEGFLPGGMAGGFLVGMGDQIVYHAGDTGLFGDMKLIGDLNQVDAALLPIGDRFTMGPADAMVAARWVRAKVTLPMHYNTFPPITQDGDAWAEELESMGLRGLALKPGQSCPL